MSVAKLVRYLEEAGAIYREGAPGASGKFVKPYVDLRKAIGNHATRSKILGMVSSSIIDHQIDTVGGEGVDGIMISSAYAQMFNINAVAIRDKRKDHGLKNIIEGTQGKSVAIIEGVSSTGNSVKRSYDTMRENSKMKIAAVCIVVDGMTDDQFSSLDKYLGGTPLISMSKRRDYV